MTAASNFVGGAPKLWVSGTTYTAGKLVISPTDFCFYVRKTAGAGTTDPASDTTNWQNTNGIKSIQRGTMGINATATITAVNTAKTELRFLGGTGNAFESSMNVPKVSNVVLTNSTTITSSTSTGAASGTVSWELTERF